MTLLDLGDLDEPMPRQAPCPGCQWEPDGCPDPVPEVDAGTCDGMGHDCACRGIVQGLWTVVACESCYLEQK